MTPKIFMAMPAYGQNNTSHTTASLVALTRVLTEREWFGGFSELSWYDLHDLRAAFLTIFFDRLDATHILFVDSDMRFEPELVLDMVSFNKPVVGCCYARKRYPIEYTTSALDGEQDLVDGFLKVEGIGFGVALISKECVQQLIDSGNTPIETALHRYSLGGLMKAQGCDRMIRAFDTVDLPDRRLSEDFSFCWRARAAGMDVWAATHHRVVHIGQHGYAGKYEHVPYRDPKPAMEAAE